MSYSSVVSPSRNARVNREPAYVPAEIFKMDDVAPGARSPPQSAPPAPPSSPRGPWRGATPTLGDLLVPALQAADRETIDLVSPSPPPSAPPAALLNVTPMRRHATRPLEVSPGGAEAVARQRHEVHNERRRAESLEPDGDERLTAEERAAQIEERRVLTEKITTWEAGISPRPQPLPRTNGGGPGTWTTVAPRRNILHAQTRVAAAAPAVAVGPPLRYNYLSVDAADSGAQGSHDELKEAVAQENFVNGNLSAPDEPQAVIHAPRASAPTVIPFLERAQTAPSGETDVFGPSSTLKDQRATVRRKAVAAATSTANKISAAAEAEAARRHPPAPAPAATPEHLAPEPGPLAGDAEDFDMDDAATAPPPPAAPAVPRASLLPPRGSGPVVRNAPASDMDRSWAARIHPLLARTLRKVDTSTDNSLIAGLNENGFWEGIRATQKYHWDALQEEKMGIYVVSIGGRDARGMNPLTVTRAVEDALLDTIGPSFPGAKPKVSPADFTTWTEDREPRPTLLATRLPPGVVGALRSGTLWALGDLCIITFDYAHGPSTYLGTISTSMEAADLATVLRDEYCANAGVIGVCDDIAKHHPEEVNDHLQSLFKTIRVVPMDIITPRSNVPTTVFHVHASVPLLRGLFYSEMREVMRGIKITTNMDGVIQMSPVRKCSTCNADDHPHGMCRARTIRGWDAPPAPPLQPAPAPPAAPSRGGFGGWRGNSGKAAPNFRGRGRGRGT